MSAYITRSKKKVGFYSMPEGMGHYFGRTAGRIWGQLELIHFLTLLSNKWAQMEPERPFGLGDLAEEDGRSMLDHKSHTTGVAADIFTIPTNPVKRRKDHVNKITWYNPKNFKDKNPEYDRERTAKLAKLIVQLRDQGFPMIQFLYNDPEVRFSGMTTHPNHDEHMHILLVGTRKYSQQDIHGFLGIAYAL